MKDSLLGAALPKELRDTFVVDLDAHIHESAAQIAPYCEQPWREALQHVATLPARYLDIPGSAPSTSPFPIFPGAERKQQVVTPPSCGPTSTHSEWMRACWSPTPCSCTRRSGRPTTRWRSRAPTTAGSSRRGSTAASAAL